MKFGIVVFPGSNCDRDCHHAVKLLGHQTEHIWYRDAAFGNIDCLILPGGFSYGDYLRSGAMAAAAPIMNAVKNFAARGGIILGICNGLQILQEAELLPGAMLKNASLKFICKDVHVRVERNDSPFTCACKSGDVLKLPIAHMDGNFFADEKLCKQIKNKRQVVFKYCDASGRVTPEFNPNGSWKNVAGVSSLAGNICGLMPHPERVVEKSLGGEDGRKIFESIALWVDRRKKGQANG